MSDVRSATHLVDDFAKHFSAAAGDARGYFVRPRRAPGVAAPAPKRHAVFVIHGISPTQQYAIQDQTAISLQSFLNAMERFNEVQRPWKATVHWPTVAPGADGASLKPSALRVHHADDDPHAPHSTVYDVYEGYWSPLSKGKTTIASAMRWILNSTFLPTSSTARIPCTKRKAAWDLWYVAAILKFIAVMAVIGTLLAIAAWDRFIPLALPAGLASTLTLGKFAANPIGQALTLEPWSYVELALDVLVVYVIAQLVVLVRTAAKAKGRSDELRGDAGHSHAFGDAAIANATFRRWATAALLVTLIVLLAAAGLVAYSFGHLTGTRAAEFAWYSLCVVLAVAAYSLARAAADFAVEDVLGDVQIYTTHDCNASYFAIRQAIIERVGDALVGVLRAVPDARMAVDPRLHPPVPYYDSVHVFGHSLGSTIGMDVLIRLRQMVEEGALTPQQWGRVRSFTTFGAALEKTKFLFDVRQPTQSAAQDQWQNDVYGRFFTRDAGTLDRPDNVAGTYWSNLWYFHDIVANAIRSYESAVEPGASFAWTDGQPRKICENHRLEHPRPFYAWVHSDYLNDPLFWQRVAPVIGRV